MPKGIGYPSGSKKKTGFKKKKTVKKAVRGRRIRLHKKLAMGIK